MEAQIVIVTINVNGLKSRLNELSVLIDSMKAKGNIPVILLNDTRLHSKSKAVKIKNYSILRQDKVADSQSQCRYSAGGLAILVPDQWVVHEYEPLTPTSSKIEYSGYPPRVCPFQASCSLQSSMQQVPIKSFKKFQAAKV